MVAVTEAMFTHGPYNYCTAKPRLLPSPHRKWCAEAGRAAEVETTDAVRPRAPLPVSSIFLCSRSIALDSRVTQHTHQPGDDGPVRTQAASPSWAYHLSHRRAVFQEHGGNQ